MEVASPLRWDDGVLLVLDQRALPAEETWVRCETPEQVAECIRTLAVRGAPAIGLAAAYGIALAGDDDPAGAAQLLRETRPTAVNLGWAIDRARVADDPLEFAQQLHRDQLAADRRMAELGAERFEPGDRALTHCNTGALATGGFGTAGGVLRAAWERNRLAQVWVDETRPLLQGARLTAWELGRAGIPFRVVADSAAGGLMARGLVDRVIVGADRIAANGDVANKVGTYPLAVLAERHGVPFYVAAPVSTIDPRDADRRRDPDRGARPRRGDRQRPRVQPRVRRHARRTGRRDLHRGRGARASLRGVDRPCHCALSIVDAAQEMLRLGLVVGTAGNVSAREGDARAHHSPRGAVRGDDRPRRRDAVPRGRRRRRRARSRRASGACTSRSTRRGPTCRAVVHTHSIHATAWSCLDEPLDTRVKEFTQAVGGEILTAEDAPPGSEDIARFAAEAVRGRNAALLYRHGVLALGDSPARALVIAQVVERHAQMAWLLR